MENTNQNIAAEPSEQTAIHARLLSAVPVDMLELIEKLDAEYDKDKKQAEEPNSL